MKILITGANGMLGSDLLNVLNSNKNNEIIATDLDTLNISKETAIEEIRKCAPELVINVAAYTDVDGCESNRNLAFEANSIGPKNLALACTKINAPLIHISTDYVFNGEKKEPYNEEDIPNPINVYGQTKLKGETFIQETFDNYFILRTSWLYGIGGNNFVKTMLKLSKSNDEISVVDDQIGSPTFTHDLAIAISNLIESDNYGIYHLTNSGNCSWFEFAKNIFEIANIDIVLNPVTTDEFPRAAQRPKNSVLNNQKWKNHGFKPLRNYKKALSDFMELIE